MRLSLAVLLFVVIPEKFHMFQHIIPFFFLFLSLSRGTFQDQEGYCCHVLLFAIVMDSVVVGSWMQRVNVLSSHQATGKKRTDSSIAGASCRNVPPANDERSGKTMGWGAMKEKKKAC